MGLKWILAIVATAIWLLFNYLRKPDKTMWFPDIGNALERIFVFMLYLIFWIVWLIIF